MPTRVISCAILFLLLNACALTVDTIDVEYKPNAAVKVLPEAKSVVVKLDVKDVRTSYLDRISSKKNGYGMEMAAIVSKRDVKSMVIDAFQSELKRLGFSVGDSRVSIKANIQKFYSDFKVGFFTGESFGEVIFFIQVQGADSKLFLAKNYKGESEITGVMLMGGENAKKSIEPAFATAVKKVMTDDEFIQAILSAHAAASTGGAEKTRARPKKVPIS